MDTTYQSTKNPIPYLNYCNVIWGGAAKTHLKSLVLLQKKCIRIICRKGYLAHTDILFKELKLPKVDQIYDISCAKFIYQCYNNSNYTGFRENLVKNSSFHNYLTRSKDQLRPQPTRLHQFNNSFLCRGIKIWNSLPDNIKSYRTLIIFKAKINNHILSSIPNDSD